MSTLSLTHAQQQFTAHLSAVENAARYAFRRRRRQDREEAVAEARAAAWKRLARPDPEGQGPLASASPGSPATRSATSATAGGSATRGRKQGRD